MNREVSIADFSNPNRLEMVSKLEAPSINSEKYLVDKVIHHEVDLHSRNFESAPHSIDAIRFDDYLPLDSTKFVPLGRVMKPEGGPSGMFLSSAEPLVMMRTPMLSCSPVTVGRSVHSSFYS